MLIRRFIYIRSPITNIIRNYWVQNKDIENIKINKNNYITEELTYALQQQTIQLKYYNTLLVSQQKEIENIEEQLFFMNNKLNVILNKNNKINKCCNKE